MGPMLCSEGKDGEWRTDGTASMPYTHCEFILMISAKETKGSRLGLNLYFGPCVGNDQRGSFVGHIYSVAMP